jgi:hypothetical protein
MKSVSVSTPISFLIIPMSPSIATQSFQRAVDIRRSDSLAFPCLCYEPFISQASCHFSSSRQLSAEQASSSSIQSPLLLPLTTTSKRDAQPFSSRPTIISVPTTSPHVPLNNISPTWINGVSEDSPYILGRLPICKYYCDT